MVEFRTDLMTEPELLEAANRIFESEEKDFEKIKSEKWYQTLFHAITLNQDGKQYAVKGIHSLAKLQQLFIEIYIRNYRHQNKQLDSIIDAVISNSVAIKKLYGTCVLELEEQADLSSLDATDSQILALFLGEYRNAEGVVLQDDVKNLVYPMPYTAVGKDEIFVGRVRQDFSVDSGINMWVVADNIRKGAATNAVQILEKILEFKKEGKM
jgi:hypothetical protein